ncbi:MAG: peptide ABC transporter substrate-binding protein [Chloroflexi bacterium]|nr:peptide ABC transporter substrate-binding protein [Chloroflexota bacterium]
MKRLRWQLLIVALALAAIGVLLLEQQPPPLPQAAATAQPVSGGIYTEAVIGSLGRLNPVLDFYNPADRDVTRLVFSALVRFDDRGIPVGDLAESWGISQDGTAYNFSIRPGVLWHDGEPLTSEDVAFTAELLRSPDLPIPDDIRALWDQVDILPLDERTIQFRLPEPFAPFLDYLSFGVLPRHLLASLPAAEIVDAPFNLAPVGSGPYRFNRIIAEDGQILGVSLAANEQFYSGRPFIDEVIFLYYPDGESALEAYRAGKALGVSQAAGGALTEALKIPELRLYTSRLPQLSLVYLNLDDPALPFFQDVALRRALLQGLNRQGQIDRLLNGQALIADSPVLPGGWAYYEGVERLEYDPQAALEAIKAAGYTIPAEGGAVRAKEGAAFSFDLAYPDDPQHAALAQAIQKDWAALGVEAVLKPVTYQELLSDFLEARDFEAALVEINLSRYPDPDPYPFWDQAQAAGGQNYGGWNDRQASEFIERARVSTDFDERLKAYRNFQARFTNQMPALPLFFPVYTYGVDQQVQGVSVGTLIEPSYRLVTLPQWHFLVKP